MFLCFESQQSIGILMWVNTRWIINAVVAAGMQGACVRTVPSLTGRQMALLLLTHGPHSAFMMAPPSSCHFGQFHAFVLYSENVRITSSRVLGPSLDWSAAFSPEHAPRATAHCWGSGEKRTRWAPRAVSQCSYLWAVWMTLQAVLEGVSAYVLGKKR